MRVVYGGHIITHMDRTGQTIGEYRLVQRLGGSSTGEVYLAEHIILKRSVAIKILYIPLQGEDLQTFAKELQPLATLIHPHIIKLLDIGIIDENIPYLVMEYAPNGTLRQKYLNASRISLKAVILYVQEIASALQYAHDRHVIHDNIKPENILLSAKDTPLLSDFGVVHSLHTPLIGNLLYAAPEHLTGSSSPASDQYALAIMAYEWLTGTLPFTGTSVAKLIMQCLTVPPPSLRLYVPDLSERVEEVVLKALAKDPADRFVTVQEFANALNHAAQSSLVASENERYPFPTSLSFALKAERYVQEDGVRLLGASAPTVKDFLKNKLDYPTILKNLAVALTESLTAATKGLPDVIKQVDDKPALAERLAATIKRLDDGLVEAKGLIKQLDDEPALAKGFATATERWEAASKQFKNPTQVASADQKSFEHSLFALTRIVLENDEVVQVGIMYTLEAGISRSKPEEFSGLPFTVATIDALNSIDFDISCHSSENIEVMGPIQAHLLYHPANPDEQIVSFHFKILRAGECSIVVDFYRERHLLQSVTLTFEALEEVSVAEDAVQKD